MPNAVVTGASRGIGRAIAVDLVQRGFHVVGLARRPSTDAVSTSIEADLASLRGIREAAAKIREALPTVDLLVHNAGVWPARLVRGEDGLEESFVVNHLAPFLLNLLLEDRLVLGRARVVLVTAGIHVKGRVDLARTPTGRDFHPIRTYASTKLLGLMMVPRFAERWRDKGPSIDAVHPGVVRTGLGDRGGLGGILLRLVKRRWMAPEDGAMPVVRLALAPGVPGGARYFDVDREAPVAAPASDRALQDRVHAHAAALAGASLDRGRIG